MMKQRATGPVTLIKGASALLLLFSLAVPAGPAAAQPVTDPDWPCAQRLVPELAPATLWQGTPLKAVEALPVDDDLQALAGELVDRGTPMDKAADEIKAAADKAAPAARGDRMQALFLAVIDEANEQRSGMIDGIRNFGRRQKALAERINGEARKIRDLQAQGTDAAATDLADLDQQRQWDMRIFDERQHTVRLACDEPVQVEQRSFALGRLIAAQEKGQAQ